MDQCERILVSQEEAELNMARHFNSYKLHGNWTTEAWINELERRLKTCQAGLDDSKSNYEHDRIPRGAYEMVRRDCLKMEKTVEATKKIFEGGDYEILMTKTEFEEFKS